MKNVYNYGFIFFILTYEIYVQRKSITQHTQQVPKPVSFVAYIWRSRNF